MGSRAKGQAISDRRRHCLKILVDTPRNRGTWKWVRSRSEKKKIRCANSFTSGLIIYYVTFLK